MKRLNFFILCLFVAVSHVANASSVWKVTKGDNTIYVAGTMHLLSPDDYPLPASYEEAYKASDTLVFETDVLTEDFTLAGDILAKLKVATTGTDADWVVKLVDVFPNDAEDTQETQKYLKMGNYHMMVRSEVMRGRFRNDFSKPEPFTANEKTAVNIKLQDVHHTFKKGHKIQIQVQSTWFPLIDLNPQTFVPNIFKAKASDFKKQTHKVFHDSAIEVSILK